MSITSTSRPKRGLDLAYIRISNSQLVDGSIPWWRWQGFLNFDAHVLTTAQDAHDFDYVIVLDIEHDVVRKVLHQFRSHSGQLRNATREWCAAFRKHRQALDRLLGAFQESQRGVDASFGNVDRMAFDIVRCFGPSNDRFQRCHSVGAF